MHEFESNSDGFEEERVRFAAEVDRIDAEIRQAITDSVYQVGGDEAVRFMADMDMQLNLDGSKSALLNFLYEIEMFFPGAAQLFAQRLQPLAEEKRENAERHLRYIEAEKDREILRHHEAMEEIQAKSLPRYLGDIAYENIKGLFRRKDR